jgi:hypothetical protein
VFPGSVEITQRLAEADERRVVLYRSALDFHYALWKWQRISEPASLAFLRRVLGEHGLVEPNPDSAWIVNRGASEYRKAFGEDYAQELERLQRETLRGHVPYESPQRILDSGSGNGTAIYESTRPGFLMVGSGLNLCFAVDGTTRNWLREPFQAPRLQVYKSTLAAHAFKLAEIWSVAHFVSPTPSDEFEPIAELKASCADGTVASAKLLTIVERTKARLAAYRAQDTDGQALVTGVALGLLIDAIASRARFPNGMQFSYPDSAIWAEVVGDVLAAVKSNPIRTDAGVRLVACAPQCEHLAVRIRRHLEDPSLSPDADSELVTMLPELADGFKSAGFELRDRNGEVRLIPLLHEIGNQLWRWHFFLSDWKEWNATEKATRSAYSSAPIVRTWLDRPWGILRQEDMELALAEGFEPSEDPPRLLSPLLPLFRAGVNGLCDEGFRAVSRSAERLRDFIAHRCQLCDSRAEMQWVSYEDQAADVAQDRELADLLVELLTVWFYAQPERTRRKMVKKGLRPLADTLQSTGWLDGLRLPQLSRRQLRLIERYRNDPKGTAGGLFEFQSGTDLLDRLDVYPSEEYWLMPQL